MTPADSEQRHKGVDKSRSLSLGIMGLSLLFLCMLLFNHLSWTRAIHGISPLIKEINTVRLELSLSHLWFEELITGDQTVEIDDIRRYLNNANKAVSDVIKRKSDILPFSGIPISSPDLSSHLENLRKEVLELKELVEQRWIDRDESGIGSEVDQRFDLLFKEALSEADICDSVIQRMVEEGLKAMQRVFFWLLAFGGILFALVSIRFYAGEKRRHHSERELQQSEGKFRALVEASNDAIILADAETGIIIDASPRAEEFFGYPVREIIGKHQREIHPIDKQDYYAEVFREHVENKKGLIEDAVIQRSDGTIIPVDISGSVFELDGRKVMQGAFRDISKRKRVEAERQKAREAAESANRYKDEFLANISHELRTPLTSIIGFGAILKNTDLNEEQKEFIRIINRCGNTLLNLINELLDISRIESGKMNLNPAPFHLTLALEKKLRPLAKKAQAKGVEFLIFVRPGIPTLLMGDADNLCHALFNLADNSVKFTESGEVMVSVGLDDPEAGPPLFHFVIRDTGIGIPRKKHEMIFDSFKQADGSSTRAYGGTGLGTTISKNLMEMMGGKIWFESEEGFGSTFHITLPLKLLIGAEVREFEKEPAGWPRLKALIVDDNRSCREFLGRSLSLWGLVAEGRGSGEEAIDALLAAREQGDPFDLCLIDCHIPGTDVPELLKEINSHDLGRLKKILLTPIEGAVEFEAEASDIEAYITKPVEQHRLFDLLQKIVKSIGTEKPGEAPHPSRPREADSGRPLTILLVEDDENARELLKTVLDNEGYSVVSVENGKKAVDMWERRGPDLILMDIQMPEMNGLEATRLIRQKEKGRGGHVPIIALTAYAMKEDRETCLKAGMDDYATKPVEIAAILSMINKYAG